MKNDRKRPLTPEERAECAALKGIWESKKRDLGLTQEGAGDAMSMSQAAVSHYLNGRTALNLPVATQFADLLECSIDDFSSRLAAEAARYAPQRARPALTVVGSSSGEVAIPQYNTGGQGGLGLVLRDQPGVIQSWSVSRDWLRANVPAHTSPEKLAIVTGFGDSMPDTYSPGDPVLVDTGITVCDHDGVYFFRVGEEGFIKRLQRIPGLGIRVLSQNKEYEPWTITPDMDFQVFGKVLRAWKGKNY